MNTRNSIKDKVSVLVVKFKETRRPLYLGSDYAENQALVLSVREGKL